MARDVPIGAGGAGRRPDARPVPTGEPEQRTRRGGPLGGAGRFVSEAWAELQKVEWPTQNQILQGTVVVLVACLIVGVFLYLNDQVWKYVVQKILIK